MLFLHESNHLLINLCLCLRRTAQRSIPAEVLVRHSLHCDHIKLPAHSVAGNHRTSELRRLLNIVGSSGRRNSENDFLCRSSSGQSRNPVLKLGLRHQIMIALLNLHRVSERTGSTRNDCDLLNRSRVCLFRCDKRMSDLMVRNRPFLLVGENCILFLVSGNDNLNTLLKIFLCRIGTTIADCTKCRLVDDVCKLRSGGSGSHARNLKVVHIVGNLDLLCMNAQNRLSALEIREFYRNTAVKSTRSCQCRIKRFRSVRRCQNDNSVISLKSIHLGEQLVQRLLSLVVSTEISAITLLSNCIDLVDEDDTRSLLFRLLKEVTHF